MWRQSPLRCLHSPDGVCLRVEDKVVQGDDIRGGEDEIVVLHRFREEETKGDRIDPGKDEKGG